MPDPDYILYVPLYYFRAILTARRYADLGYVRLCARFNLYFIVPVEIFEPI